LENVHGIEAGTRAVTLEKVQQKLGHHIVSFFSSTWAIALFPSTALKREWKPPFL
jgi:hypothetical protein